MAAYNGWMGDYNVPNIAPQLSQLAEASDTVRTNMQNRAVGEAAATGKLSDAANVAFKQGNVKTGLALKDLDDDRRMKVGKIIGQAALNADTPEKWAQLQASVAKRFPGEELEPFEEREGVVSMYRDYYKDRDDARADRAEGRADRMLGLREREVNAKTAPGGRPKLNVIDKKEIFEAEDRVTGLKHTIDNLRAAKSISSKAYEGFGAGARGVIGGKVFGTEAGEATLEYEKIMTPEALASMAATLKGATTDQEMNRYIDLISDPSTPIEIRNRTIDRMIALAERQASLDTQRINEIRGDTYYDPGGGLSEGGAKPDPKNDPLGLR